ncbi:MAG TPA: hypothetical protein VHV30_08445 [Polyangiaceae bacterium]|jgi:hypothetical protein|nr:hypothetical protein [Polyangiaceae bacterium]
MNRATSFAVAVAAGIALVGGVIGASGGTTAIAAPPKAAADAPVVPTLAAMHEKELRWGLSHLELTDIYNGSGGLFDQEYAPLISRLQPSPEMTRLENDRDLRKANFARAYAVFGDSPSGYDVTPLRSEYTYNNDEAIMRVFKDGKNRSYFFIKDKLWKFYDEIPLKADGPLGDTYKGAIAKLNAVLGVPGRTRAADPAHGIERTTTDWQDARSHLRADDRSGEHLLGLVMEDKRTIAVLAQLRPNQAKDPFAIDPSIAQVTKGGISDPNASHGPAPADSSNQNKGSRH